MSILELLCKVHGDNDSSPQLGVRHERLSPACAGRRKTCKVIHGQIPVTCMCCNEWTGGLCQHHIQQTATHANKNAGVKTTMHRCSLVNDEGGWGRGFTMG